MSTNRKQRVSDFVDQWIDHLAVEPDRSAPPFFAEKLMNRIQSEQADHLQFRKQTFYRAVAATIAVLVLLNFYTIITQRQQSRVETSNSAPEQMWAKIDNDSYNNYSRLALE
jgi:hypothetical protein